MEDFASKVFPDLYSQADKPAIAKQETITARENGKVVEADGAVSFEFRKTNGLYSTNVTNVRIAKSAFQSFLKLGEVVGHELNHVVDHLSGCYASWMNFGGQDYAHNMSELSSWSWQHVVSPTVITAYRVNQYMSKL